MYKTMQNAVNARSCTSTILVSFNQTGLILNLGLSQLSLFPHIGYVETQVWEYECVDFCVVTQNAEHFISHSSWPSSSSTSLFLSTKHYIFHLLKSLVLLTCVHTDNLKNLDISCNILACSHSLTSLWL